MKKLFFLGVLCLSRSAPAVFARGGGMGSHHFSALTTGGASGESPFSLGTNSLGTALSSNGVSNPQKKGPLLGTSPAVDQEEAKAVRAVSSICRRC